MSKPQLDRQQLFVTRFPKMMRWTRRVTALLRRYPRPNQAKPTFEPIVATRSTSTLSTVYTPIIESYGRLIRSSTLQQTDSEFTLGSTSLTPGPHSETEADSTSDITISPDQTVMPGRINKEISLVDSLVTAAGSLKPLPMLAGTLDISACEDLCPDLTGKVQRPISKPVYTGPYSHVFKGICEGTEVSIKVIRTLGSLPALRRRTRREVETASRFKHPNILTALGVVEAEWCPFGCIITQWCLNGDASKYVRLPHVGESERYKLFSGVAAGVEYLHAQQVVHGDLKPANILVDESGNPRICDFGLVRILDADKREQGDDINTTTMHIGTVRYLAFELVEPDTPAERTKASDVHALGCVGYEFLYLEKPYATRPHNTGGHIFRDIANGVSPAYRPSGALTATVAAIWNLLEDCWKRNPGMRPSSSDVCYALGEIANHFALDASSQPFPHSFSRAY